jgi:small-conductance mechanosensitive channel
MPTQEIFTTLNDLWQDLRHPDVLWQTAALIGCFFLAWQADRQLRRVQGSAAESADHWLVSRGGVKRLFFPLLSLLLVVLVRLLLHPYMHVNLLTLAIPLLASLAVIRAVLYVLRVSFAPSGWVAALERSFAVVVWLAVALQITGLLPSVIDAMESVTFHVGKQKLDLWMLLQGLVTVVATVFLALWASSVVERKLLAAAGLDSNLRVVFVRISKALMLLLAILIALPMVGIDLTTLSVFGGALGVGLGLGLQRIASNYVSGFIILLDRSIRIGNVITVGSDRGEVIKITTRYTVLRGLTGVEAIVPNEVLVGSVVLNESYTDPKVRVALPVQVGYASNVERVMDILVEVARQQPRILAEPPPLAFCLAFADSGINLELGFWIADPQEGIGLLRSAINLEILSRFRAEGIEIPYPQREVRLLEPTFGNQESLVQTVKA